MKKFLLSSCIALSAMTMYADSWTKVTDASDITFDSQYLIVCESKNVVMGAEIGSAKFLPKVDTQAISNNSITTDGTEAFAIVTFEGTDFNACQVKISTLDGTAKGYYKTTAAKSMSLDASSGTNAAVTLATNGDVEIKFGSYGTIKYNASAPRFVNYASGQTAVQLYKKEAGGDTDTKTALTLSFPEKSYSVNIGEQFTAPELRSDPEEAINNISLAYSSSDGNVATVDNNGNVDIKNEGTTVITVSFEGDEIYKAASSSYILTVVDPSKVVYEDNLTATTFGVSGSAYENYDYTSTQTSVNYVLKCSLSNSNMQINSTNAKNGKNSCMISTANPKGLTISKIVVTTSSIITTLIVEASENPWSLQGKATSTVIIAPENATTLTNPSVSNSKEYTYTPTADFKYFYIHSTKAVQITKIDVYYNDPSTPGKEKVEVTFDGEEMNVEFEEGKQVQGLVASVDVDGLTLSYSSSDANVATVDNNGMLTIVGVGTTTITATVDESSNYTGKGSYTLTVNRAYHNFNEILANAKVNEEIKAKFPMTVGYVNGINVFVTDNQGGYMLLYGTTPYAAGDIIPAGMKGTYIIYGGLPELKPTTTPEATEKGEYAIETVEASEVMSQPLNKIVKVMDVNFAAATPADKSNFTGTVEETSLAFYNSMALASVEAGTYDVTMVVSTYTRNATAVQAPNQLQPIEYVAVPTAPVVMIDGEAVDTDAAFELQGKEVVVYLTAQEGASIWYKFTAANTDNSEVAPLAEDGFTEYTAEGITIGENLGTLEYYSELNGRKSAISSLTFQGTPTAINEIEASEGTATEWFDMSGRRVATPSKGGIYVKKTGSKVSKYAF